MRTLDPEGAERTTRTARRTLRGANVALVAVLLAAAVAVASGPVEQAKLVAADPQSEASFGHPAALDGDTAAVGSGSVDLPGAPEAGAVYVFTRSGAAWTQQAKLVAADAATLDAFGSAVALRGDSALIGAYLDDHAGGTDAGSVYEFERTGSAWTQTSRFTGSDTTTDDWFGGWIARDGATAVVGAMNADTTQGTDAGAVYVFVRNGSAWTQQAKLVDPDGGAMDGFGQWCDIDGDTIVVGSYQDDTTAGADAGSVSVFTRSGTTWTRQARLEAPDAVAGDWFGVTVDVSGDTIAVGAPVHEHGGPVRSGATYVFRRSGTTWTLEAEIRSPVPAADAVFGHPALSGDTLVVAATGDSLLGHTAAGSAHIFTRSGGVWTFDGRLTASDAADFDRFGFPTIDGTTALITSGLDDHSAVTDAGSVYVFTGLPYVAPPEVPDPPENLRARRGPRAGLVVSWTDTGTAETSFRLERRRGAGSWELLATPPADVTTWSDATTEPGIRFTYRIRAENDAGASEWAPDASAVPDPSGDGLDVAVSRGSTLRDLPGDAADIVTVTGRFGRNHLASGAFVPGVDPVRIDAGDGGDDALFRLDTADAAGTWKVDTRRGRAVYTRKDGARVVESFTLDTKKGTFALRAKSATLARLPVQPVRVLLELGANSGAHVAEWTQPKPDRVVYAAGLATIPLDAGAEPYEGGISYRGDADRYDFTVASERDVRLRFTPGTIAAARYTVTGPGTTRTRVGTGTFTASGGAATWNRVLAPGTYVVTIVSTSVARYGTYTIELDP